MPDFTATCAIIDNVKHKLHVPKICRALALWHLFSVIKSKDVEGSNDKVSKVLNKKKREEKKEKRRAFKEEKTMCAENSEVYISWIK